MPGMSEPTPGEAYRALWETLNRRLAALGVFSRSRYDLSPRLDSGDWEKLVTLAELGKGLRDGSPGVT